MRLDAPVLIALPTQSLGQGLPATLLEFQDVTELNTFVENAATIGQFESSGVFTLDEGAAKSKVLDFFAQCPGLWVLKFAQAAVLAQADAAWLRIGYRTLSFGIEGSPFLALPEELMSSSASDPIAGLIGTGIQAATSEMAKVTWLVSGPERVSCGVRFSSAQEPVFLDETTTDEQLRQLKLTSHANQYGVLVCELPGGSWWNTLCRNLRYRTGLVQSLRSHLKYSPVPIKVGGLDIGGGGREGRKEVAAEYHLGHSKNDVFVSEREPGNGSRIYHVFGQASPFLQNCPRLLSRWCLDESTLFENSNVETKPVFLKFLGSTTGTPTEQKQSLPPQSVPMWGRQHFSPAIVSYLRFPKSLLSGTYRHRFTSASPGLNCHLMLSISYPLKKLSVLEFVRHGVRLEKQTLDLNCPGLYAVVACSKLKTDATSMGVVQDSLYDELLTFIQHRYLNLVKVTLQVAEANGWQNEKACRDLQPLRDM